MFLLRVRELNILVNKFLDQNKNFSGRCLNRIQLISNEIVSSEEAAANDTEDDILWGINKLLNMKILKDKKGETNLNTLEKKSDLLIISQFTLFASTKKGNKPSWHKAATSKVARTLYDQFINFLQKKYLSKNIKTGFFGSNLIPVLNLESSSFPSTSFLTVVAPGTCPIEPMMIGFCLSLSK